jgi:hypothetical protein
MGLTEQEEIMYGWPFYAHQLDDAEVESCSCGSRSEEPERGVDGDDDRPK